MYVRTYNIAKMLSSAKLVENVCKITRSCLICYEMHLISVSLSKLLSLRIDIIIRKSENNNFAALKPPMVALKKAFRLAIFQQ